MCQTCDEVKPKRSTKRYTYEEVKASFDAELYTLISHEYKGNKAKLDYICPKGHPGSIAWKNWNVLGQRCATCNGNPVYTIEMIRETFTSEGFQLLDDEYKGSEHKYRFICPQGHNHSVSWNHWLNSGSRCLHCSHSAPPDVEMIRDALADEGYTLTSGYKNAKTKIKFICPEGHDHSIEWNNWLSNGQRCGKCFGANPASIDDVRKAFEAEGYELMNDNYENSKSYLDFICPKGHQYRTTWQLWKDQGCRCGICHQERKYSDIYTKSPYIRIIDRSWRLTKKKVSEIRKMLDGRVEIEAIGELYEESKRQYRRGNGIYAVDHQIPLSWFDHNNVDEVIAAWSLTNLRLITAIENQLKGSRLTPEVLERIVMEPEMYAIYKLASKVPAKVAERVAQEFNR